MSGQYDLSTVPDPDSDERYAEERGRYLTRKTDLDETLTRALSYRELGYSRSGIARQLDVTEGTASGWLDTIAERYGLAALETRPQSRPVEALV